MKIVLALEKYWPASGGAEEYARSIAQSLVERHQVRVVTLVRDDRAMGALRRSLFFPAHLATDDGAVRVLQLSASLGERLRLAPLLLEAVPHRSRWLSDRLRRWRYERFASVLLPAFVDAVGDADVIHTVAPWEMSHLAHLASKVLGIPHVITGLMHPGYWADDPQSVALFRDCERVIALLPSEKEAYIAAGVPAQNIEVVGVPAQSPLQSDPSLFRDMFSVSPPIVLFLGVKRWYKGYDLLVAAAPQVWEQHPSVTFVFLGPRTRESKAFFRTVRDQRIVEIDKVPDEVRDSAISAADIICLPSATEILPNVVLEAWSAGKPVVVSDIPTLRELVAGCGLSAPRTPTAIAAALNRLLSDPLACAPLVEAARQKAIRLFSPARIASSLESIYVDVHNSKSLI